MGGWHTIREEATPQREAGEGGGTKAVGKTGAVKDTLNCSHYIKTCRSILLIRVVRVLVCMYSVRHAWYTSVLFIAASIASLRASMISFDKHIIGVYCCTTTPAQNGSRLWFYCSIFQVVSPLHFALSSHPPTERFVPTESCWTAAAAVTYERGLV